MFYFCISVALIAIFPLHECRVKRQEPYDLDFISEAVNKLSADVDMLTSNPHDLTARTTTNAVEQIRSIGRNLKAMKVAIMNKFDRSEVDLDAQVQVKLLQLQLKKTAERLQHLTESPEARKAGKLQDVVKGVGNLITGAAKTFGKVARGIKETVGHGVSTVKEVASSLLNTFLKTGNDVYNILNEAVLQDSEK